MGNSRITRKAKVGNLVLIECLLSAVLSSCSVPSAPPRVQLSHGAGEDDPCSADTDTSKKSKTSIDSKIASKTAQSRTALKEEEEEEEEECEDTAKPTKTGASSTLPANTTGIITPGTQGPTQAVPGNPQLAGTNSQPLALAPTYKLEISSYLTKACTSCHSGGLFKPSPNLSTYEAASKSAASSLASMKKGSMPTSARATAEEISVFEAWVTAGTPQ